MIVKCEECGRHFEPAHMQQKYCSNSCQQKHTYKKGQKRSYYKYYAYSRGKYVVRKWKDNHFDNFGSYDTEEEAQVVVKWLQKHHWSKKAFDDAKNKWVFKVFQ